MRSHRPSLKIEERDIDPDHAAPVVDLRALMEDDAPCHIQPEREKIRPAVSSASAEQRPSRAARDPAGPEPRAGSRLGPYYLQALVGEGGMGRVFRAVHEKLGRHVAIKLMRRSVSLDGGVARFLREARVVNKVRHENLIEITDIHEALPGGDSYYVMEWLEGKNLHERMLECQGLVPLPEAVRTMIEVCRGLEAAHAAGLVHRDLKPENIYLSSQPDGTARIKVIDFGVALDTSEGHGGREEYVVGTPAYIAPEQAQGFPGDRRADIYSFGVILYELSTGRVPFAAPTTAATVALHLAGAPLRPRRAAPRGVHVPRALERIILRCMALDPEARYATMDEVRGDLEALLRALEGSPWRRRARAGLRLGLPLLVLGALGGGAVAVRGQAVAAYEQVAGRLHAWLTPRGEADPAPPPLLLQVDVRTTPPGAEVRYGGAVLCTTPCVARLPEGPREIELRRPGYRREHRTVQVRVGARVAVKLSK